MSAELIFDAFPQLTEPQREQIRQLGPLYQEWNQRINVISRKDIDNLYPHHVLHSLAIAKFIRFQPGADVLDLGTGGGFPGIPLAILFPETRFHLVDSIRKKITVVAAAVEALGLDNVTYEQRRAEEIRGRKFDFIVTRAVAKLDKLLPWTAHLVKGKQQHAIPNGLIALKGIDISAEVKVLPKGIYIEVEPLSQWFAGAFFESKGLVYVQG
jgi:16S rRNA (guanine527-N7)-methyltransferase